MRIRNDGTLLKTKIVATVGEERGGDGDEIFDAQCRPIDKNMEPGTLLQMLIEAGIDVVRLNMSFAATRDVYGDVQAKTLNWLNKHKLDIARHVAVLGDLPGPKIRLAADKIQELAADEEFLLDFNSTDRLPKDAKGASVLVSGEPFERCAAVDGAARIGDYLRDHEFKTIFSIGDGKILLAAASESDGIVACSALRAGIVRNGQGLTIKNARIDSPAFGEPDKRALEFLLQTGGEILAFVSVSFVKNKNDILNVRRHAEEFLQKLHQLASTAEARKIAPSIIAKIETLDAWRNIDEILDVADGVMVARGDLGLQLDPAQIPAIQKQLIRKCNLRGKPVITATQMLDSMEQNFDPTRAETTDVFNAILDGTDVVMLSGETALGKYPFRAVEMMTEIAEQAENYYFANLRPARFNEFANVTGATQAGLKERLAATITEINLKALNATVSPNHRDDLDWQRNFYQELLANAQTQIATEQISQSACVLSEDSDYKAILALTNSGRAVRMMSRFRPHSLIIGVADSDWKARRLILSFGVYPLFLRETSKMILPELLAAAASAAKNQGYHIFYPDFSLLASDDLIIVTGCTPPLADGTTNLLQIHRVSRL